MINRENWKLSKEYLEYRFNIDQISLGSLQKEETHFRYLLEWAQEKPFIKADEIRPALPEFLLNNRLDDLEEQLSDVYLKKILATSRRFFTWLSDYKTGYKRIKPVWIKSLKVKRLQNIPKTHEVVSIKEIILIANLPTTSLADKRAQAMAVFLYLSGMRIGAFVSLPILAIDIQNRTVKQYPELGVNTKNGKRKLTHLWNIPELLAVVESWDNLVRGLLPETAMWFTPLSPKTGQIDLNNLGPSKTRVSIATRSLKTWLTNSGQDYHSPHKFRHGHIHYGLERCKTRADFKAVSENVMHESTSTTDQYYSNHGDQELKNRIDQIGGNNKKSSANSELFKEFELFLAWKEAQKNTLESHFDPLFK